MSKKEKNHIAPTPPRFLFRFFKWFCHPDLHTYIEGDLLELYQERVKQLGKSKADWRFAIDVLLLFRPSIIKPLQGYHRLNHYGMFKNYFKVGVRNILKYKTFSFINVLGLAVAMSVFMLIILMLADQKSYDQFHEKKDRIYRVLMKSTKGSNLRATTPFPLAESLKTEYGIIEEATYLRRGFGGDAVYDQNFVEMKGYFTTPAFFKIFSYELEKGDPYTALNEPNSLVVTSKIATQLFGNENPIGKTVDFTDRGINFGNDERKPPVDWGVYTVTGVLADNDYKSHIEFDVLVSSSSLALLSVDEKINDLSENWMHHNSTYTYVLLNNNAYEENLKAALDHLAPLKFGNIENLNGWKLSPQSLNKITPGPKVNNAPFITLPMFAYYFLIGLALVVMFTACLNYTNLSVARALTRAKEIGVRKVNGAHRKDLIFQFLSESMLTAFLSLILAVGLLFFIKSAFLNLWVNQYLNFDLDANIEVYFIFIALALLIGLIAGIFPAFRLSGYKPVKALKNMDGVATSRLGVRKVLTIVQFVISLVFIITSIVGFNQFQHFMQYEYGFDPHNVVNINLQSNDYELVKKTLNEIPGVTDIAGSAYLPGSGRNDGIMLKKYGAEETEIKEAIDLSIDESFINVLDIELLAGRNLSTQHASSNSLILVNEEMAKVFGYDNPADIVGQSFEGNNEIFQVAGLVENFTFSLLFLRQITRPVVLRNEPAKFNFANVKIASADKKEIVTQLEEKWKTVDPIHPLKYEFFEDKLANYHQGIFDLVTIIGFFAFLVISIACMGLLGMVIYTTERRTKEIGIRKVLGAESINLTYLLSKEFLLLLGISILIAAPLSYFINSFWLNFLVVRVEFGLSTILLGSVFLLLLGLLTISPQTFFVSRRNPADSLKDE
ncbi:MAG: ABC transporter permease [Bacteroidota bacterium]